MVRRHFARTASLYDALQSIIGHELRQCFEPPQEMTAELQNLVRLLGQQREKSPDEWGYVDDAHRPPQCRFFAHAPSRVGLRICIDRSLAVGNANQFGWFVFAIIVSSQRRGKSKDQWWSAVLRRLR
jgi:hypothetical protein